MKDITLLLLSLMLFAAFDSCYHITKAYKDNSKNITIKFNAIIYPPIIIEIIIYYTT